MKSIRRHLTYANIAATLALALALGGTGAYAATLITSKMIKNGTIQNIDIHNGAIHSNKIHDGTIQTADLAPSARSTVYVGTVQGQSVWADSIAFPIESVTIPTAGSYLLTATLSLLNNDTINTHDITCTLDAGDSVSSASKVAYANLGSAAVDYNRGTIALQLPHAYSAQAIAAGTVTATVSCETPTAFNGATDVHVYAPMLTAVRVAAIQ